MSIKAKPKKTRVSGPDRDPMMGFRAAPVLRASIVKWPRTNLIGLHRSTLSGATRRLAELGLAIAALQWAERASVVVTSVTKRLEKFIMPVILWLLGAPHSLIVVTLFSAFSRDGVPHAGFTR